VEFISVIWPDYMNVSEKFGFAFGGVSAQMECPTRRIQFSFEYLPRLLKTADARFQWGNNQCCRRPWLRPGSNIESAAQMVKESKTVACSQLST
jgi:hypothetical protein